MIRRKEVLSLEFILPAQWHSQKAVFRIRNDLYWIQIRIRGTAQEKDWIALHSFNSQLANKVEHQLRKEQISANQKRVAHKNVEEEESHIR